MLPAGFIINLFIICHLNSLPKINYLFGGIKGLGLNLKAEIALMGIILNFYFDFS